jgi:regulator of sirC expression with transglutaminase-like and TPR domain
MSGQSDIMARLGALGTLDDGALDLAETALLLAALDHPDIALDRYRKHLENLGREVVAEAKGGGLADRVKGLTAVMAGRYEYQGDRKTYDDPDNANLIRVIDRKMGLPVALGILYIHAARAAGCKADGLNVPAHFLIRIGDGGEHLALDPFNGGRVVGPAEIGKLLGIPGGDGPSPRDFGAMANREILLRLQNNIKARALQAKDLQRAVAVLRSMIAFSPASVGLWWEAATHLMTLGQPTAATELLYECLAHPAMNGEAPPAIMELLSGVKRRLN